MDADGLRDRTRAAAAWLDATTSEVVGLVVLLAGALAVAAVLWWSGRPHPVGVPAAPTLAGASAAEDGGQIDGELVSGEVTVHVAGAVVRPGLVTVGGGARVAEAIEAAGGPAPDATLDPLNLARVVEDGERILVPVIGAVAEEHAPTGTAGAVRADGRVDLNQATAADLQELPGIGPVLAERIVAHRDANGPFREVGELRQVSGIGEQRFQDLADLVAV